MEVQARNKLYPFQEESVTRIIKEFGGKALIADEMRLGKTVQAIEVANRLPIGNDPPVENVLICCPNSLCLHWASEWSRWSYRQLPVHIFRAANQSAAAKQAIRETLQKAPGVHIIPYSQVAKVKEILWGKSWDLVILDEAHFIKNEKAQRTRALVPTDGEGFEPRVQSRYRIALTGTPFDRSPIELYPILTFIDPETYAYRYMYYHFSRTYAPVEPKYFGRRVVYTHSARNIKELNQLLRERYMIRRRLADVIKQLPAKIRQIVPVQIRDDVIQQEKRVLENGQNLMREIQRLEQFARRSGKEYYQNRQLLSELKASYSELFQRINVARHQTALEKIPAVLEHVQTTLAEVPKLVLFSYHQDVTEFLISGLSEYPLVRITAQEDPDARAHNIRQFQNDPNIRLAVCSVGVSSLGIDLSAANVMIFAELPWSTTMLIQAEARCENMARQNPLLIQHVLAAGSIDIRVAEVLLRKMSNFERALDGEKQDEQLTLLKFILNEGEV